MQNVRLQSRGNDIELLLETSWEVCNKIGGIYTVLSTKARVLQEKFGDKLVFIGPDVWTETNPSPYFIERKTLLKSCASKMKLPFGISIRAGRWNIPGSPQVILVKFDGVYPHLNEIFGKMWELYGVNSMNAYGDYHEGCAFAVASAIVMNALSMHMKVKPEGVTAHFNEWTTAMGLLYLKMIQPEAATLFTTHATSIGRSICGNGKPLYDYFAGYNGDQMAGELNMEAKHSLEKTAAHQADCFTAVSEITARECEQLLDIRPQVVTPNGFEPDFVPTSGKYASLRKEARKRLLDLAGALKRKKFDENTLIVATSGRNEYRNKGLDLFLDSLVALQN
ncbi:MAG: glycogen/starch synthase, partial [Muribaculaceae bacterium]|nr:glycogen/starch synthase [Muribaculaceae bacterium]